MSKFTKSFTDTFEFDGDTISVKMARLKRPDMMALVPLMSEEGLVTIEDQMEIMNLGAEILPRYVKAFGGLMIEDVELTEESEFFKSKGEGFFDESYFSPLIGKMIGSLMTNSFMEKSLEKKSDSTSAKTTEGSEQITSSPSKSAES